MKKQEIVLDLVSRSAKKLSVEDIVRETGLKRGQVYEALRGLDERGLIIKESSQTKRARQHNPPINNVYISLNEKRFKKIKAVLSKAKHGK